MNRKFFALVVLFLWMSPCSILYIIYSFQRMQCRIENEKMDHPSDVQLITLNADTPIRWVSENKEFILDGKLYDVIHSFYKNGKHVLKCRADHAEDTLVLNYHRSLAKRKREYNTISGKVSKITCIKNEPTFIPYLHFIPLRKPIAAETGFCGFEPDIVSPPPEGHL